VNRQEAESLCNWWTCKVPDTVPFQTPNDAIEEALEESFPDVPATLELSGYAEDDENGESDFGGKPIYKAYSEEINVQAWLRAQREDI
jgi:hypothetical protein